MLYILSFRTLV